MILMYGKTENGKPLCAELNYSELDNETQVNFTFQGVVFSKPQIYSMNLEEVTKILSKKGFSLEAKF